MITRRALEELARKQKLTLGNAEKDYLLDLILRSIAKYYSDTLVFKGGTCLYKFYNLPRFSEDLDFSAVKNIDINAFVLKIIADLEKEGIHASEHTRKEPYNSVLITLRIKGPLLTENPSSLASVGIDIKSITRRHHQSQTGGMLALRARSARSDPAFSLSLHATSYKLVENADFKSEVLLPIERRKYISAYPNVGEISILGMKSEEMLAEKLRALLTRFKARDLFDIYFLINKEVQAPKKLIQAKMNYYQEIFSIEKLLKRIDVFKPIWDKEILGLTKNILSFESVAAQVKQKLKEKYA